MIKFHVSLLSYKFFTFIEFFIIIIINNNLFFPFWPKSFITLLVNLWFLFLMVISLLLWLGLFLEDFFFICIISPLFRNNFTTRNTFYWLSTKKTRLRFSERCWLTETVSIESRVSNSLCRYWLISKMQLQNMILSDFKSSRHLLV